jgi:hydrogenase expression/formation protein HypD
MRYKIQSFADAFRDSETAKKTVKLIEELAGDSRKYRIVHVCGTHEDTITKHGIRSMLTGNI